MAGQTILGNLFSVDAALYHNFTIFSSNFLVKSCTVAFIQVVPIVVVLNCMVVPPLVALLVVKINLALPLVAWPLLHVFFPDTLRLGALLALLWLVVFRLVVELPGDRKKCFVSFFQ